MFGIRSTLRFFVAASVLFVSGCYGDAPLDVAPSVDLHQFQGRWYEIAKLPRYTEKNCTGTVASYALSADGTLSLESDCHLNALDGPLKTMTATATVPDPSVPAKLALNVGGFYGDYWILEVGAHYEYAVIGHPSRQYFWILSRTTKLDAAVLAGILERAHSQKFDLGALEYTQQPD